MKVYENLDLQDLKNETWKTIEDFPEYQVSNYGIIKSFKQDKISGKILKPYKNNENYYVIDLYNIFGRKVKKVHILLFESFIGKIPKNYVVHHIDFIKENNNLNNFKLMSKSEHHSLHNQGKILSEEHKNKISLTRKEKLKNNLFCVSDKSKNTGENNSNHKLEEWQVKAIYQISNSSIIKQLKITQKEIGEVFNISSLTVNRIKNKKSWSSMRLENI